MKYIRLLLIIFSIGLGLFIIRPVYAAGVCSGGPGQIWTPNVSHWVCDSDNSTCNPPAGTCGDTYCGDPGSHQVFDSCGSQGVRIPVDCDPASCDSATCTSPNTLHCLDGAVNGHALCSWDPNGITPTGTLNCGGGGGGGGLPLVCSNLQATVNGTDYVAGVSNNGQQVPILSIAPGDTVHFYSDIHPGDGRAYFDKAEYDFGSGSIACYENFAYASQPGPPYNGVYFCNNGQSSVMPMTDPWHPATPFPLPSACGPCLTGGPRPLPTDWPDEQPRQRLVACSASTGQQCYISIEGTTGKPYRYASDGNTIKTYSTQGIYHVKVYDSFTSGWGQEGSGNTPCRVDICVGSSDPACATVTNTPTPPVPTIYIRGRVENELYTSPLQCVDNSFYYENGAGVNLYNANGTLLQSVTTYPGPGPTNTQQPGYYQFTVTGQPQGHTYYVCGVDTPSRIFTQEMLSVSITPPACAGFRFQGMLCINYQNVSGPQNGRLIARAPTPTPIPTSNPTPVQYTPTLSCGTYNAGNDTYTVNATWTPSTALPFVMSPNADYSSPYINGIFAPPQSYAGVPSGTTVYARVTSGGVNYPATPITCIAPTITNPPPYGDNMGIAPTGSGGPCNLWGWACDDSDPRVSIHVNLYADGSITPFGQALAQFPTPQPGAGTPPVPGGICSNSTAHGYLFPLPQSLQNGVKHLISAKAVGIPTDLTATPVQLLPGPVGVTCSNPATPTPAPWIQLKSSSFQSSYSLSDPIPTAPMGFGGGAGQANFIFNTVGVSDPGAVTANGITLNSYNPNAVVSVNNWKNNSYIAEGININDFIQYTKAKKTYVPITDLNGINASLHNQIYLISNNSGLVVNSGEANNIANAAPILILLDNSNITINVASFNPGNAPVTILASVGASSQSTGKIIFSSSTTNADGIFIADTIDTGSAPNQGLQIQGNLITNNLINGRKWAAGNSNRPSLYIVHDIGSYVKSLSLLSKYTYEWTQLQ